jgi:hypothetical protein
MGYTRGVGFFVRMSVENKLSRQILKMTPMKNDSKTMKQKSFSMADVVVSSCVFSALDRPKTLPKWEPLGTFILCNDYAKTAFFRAIMSAGNMNKP